MHWIDPIFLPAVAGEVERFIINPHGELDGLVLAGGHLVHFPPHLSEAVVAAIRPGDTISVHGVRLRSADMIAAVSLTAASGEVILDEGPDAQKKKPHNGKHDKPKRQKLDARGTVRLPLFGPKGELRGALLDEGTVLRVNPKEALRLADLLGPGAVIEARGEGLDTKHGRVIEVFEIAATGSELKPVKKQKPGEHGTHEEDESHEDIPRG